MGLSTKSLYFNRPGRQHSHNPPINISLARDVGSKEGNTILGESIIKNIALSRESMKAFLRM